MGLPTYFLVEWHPKGTEKKSERQLLLYHGSQGQQLLMQGVDVEPMARWTMNQIDWGKLRDLLCQSFLWE
jgi:hypothetical protein